MAPECCLLDGVVLGLRRGLGRWLFSIPLSSSTLDDYRVSVSPATNPSSPWLVTSTHGFTMCRRRRGSSKLCTWSRFSGMPITHTCEPVECQFELRMSSVSWKASTRPRVCDQPSRYRPKSLPGAKLVPQP